jgi:hypothetical protein
MTYLSSSRSSLFTLAVLPSVLQTGWKIEKSSTSAWNSDRLSSFVKEENLRRKRIVQYDFSAPNQRDQQISSEGTGSSSFEKNSRAFGTTPGPRPYLRDRKVEWNRKKAYREHPYWSTNLKYVC